MDADGLWALIEDCKGKTQECEELADLIVERLSVLPSAEIAEFIRLFDAALDKEPGARTASVPGGDPSGAEQLVPGAQRGTVGLRSIRSSVCGFTRRGTPPFQ